MQPFEPRPIRPLGVRTRGPWQVKLYSIAFEDRPVDWAGFEPALERALDTLPSPDPGAGRPGLGFAIAHQGRTGDYLVLGTWNHENELPVRVWVRRTRAEPWRTAHAGESFCVWDLEVLWAERQAWVETMLGPDGPSPAAYLARMHVTT